MPTVSIAGANYALQPDTVRMLLASWVARLATEAGARLDGAGFQNGALTLGGNGGPLVVAQPIQIEPYLRFETPDEATQQVIDRVAAQAWANTQRAYLGDTPIWYSFTTTSSEFRPSFPAFSLGSLLERNSLQTRILGLRRLTSSLLDFTEDTEPGQDPATAAALFAPKAKVAIHIAVPAPCIGHFSSFCAHGSAEVAVAVCSFALGRAVALPPTLFPSDASEIPGLNARQLDPAIQVLARKSVGLDIFGVTGWPGGFEYFQRTRAALLTFAAALEQQRDDIACLLYIVAAESLSMPNAPWRHEQLTTRFFRFFDGLIPEALDKIVDHANFEQAFGIRRGGRQPKALRKALLETLYEFRSSYVHAGLPSEYRGVISNRGTVGGVRRALFADFAEAAILGYLSSPRSTLVGHPHLKKEGAAKPAS